MVNGNLMHQIRLYSGLVLFVLALTHFINLDRSEDGSAGVALK